MSAIKIDQFNQCWFLKNHKVFYFTWNRGMILFELIEIETEPD